MMKKSLIKILILLPMITLLNAKETPITSHLSLTPSLEEITQLKTRVMTPVEMLIPASFDTSYFLDYSTVIQMLWI